MQPKIVPGYEGGVSIGQRQLFCFYATGKSSYASSAGDAVSFPAGIYIDAIFPTMTVSKTYEVRFYPSVTGTSRASWVSKWYVISTGAEANSVDLSGEYIQFGALGGEF